MTVLTKPSSEKKGDNLIVPLVDNDQLASATPTIDAPNGDPESQSHNIVLLRTRSRRVSTTVTSCLLLTALIVVGIGMVVGFHLYNQYVRAEVLRTHYVNNEIKALGDSKSLFAKIPYSDQEDSERMNEVVDDLLAQMDTLREQMELDTEYEQYEKITVPDFRDGRNGRFIHDFNQNVTGIIDVAGKRCFVMPLDRDRVMPPKTLYDLMIKMWDGYYKVDTQVVRETMRVITPPIEDTDSVGMYISRECEGRPIYRLEKYVGGVVKRSANPQQQIKFIQFAGKGITEFDIINLQDAVVSEK